MAPDPALTVREIAALAGVPKAAVDKAIETEVLRAALVPSDDGVNRRRLPARAVAYFAALEASGLADLPVRHKRRLWEAMGQEGNGEDGGDGLPEAVEFAPRRPGSRSGVWQGHRCGAALGLPRRSGPAHQVRPPTSWAAPPVIRGTRGLGPRRAGAARRRGARRGADGGLSGCAARGVRGGSSLRPHPSAAGPARRAALAARERGAPALENAGPRAV